MRAAGAPLPAGYYGLPLLKAPVWTWEVPAYFFAGGAAGAVAVIGFAARVTRAGDRLVRDARHVAAIGGGLSTALLIADLGRPDRFLNMLRVFKPQSPMSVGSWMLAVFGTSTAAATLLRNRGADVASAVSAVSGLGMLTYTGVLLGATAIPVWSANVRLLPAHFAASGLGSGASLLELRGHRHQALQLLGIAASVFETMTGAAIESRGDRASAPLRRGGSGAIAHIGGVLSGPVPIVLRLLGRRRAAATAMLAGSLMTRMAWVAAGRASVRDTAEALGQGATTQRVCDSRSEKDSRDGSAASANPIPPVSSEK